MDKAKATYLLVAANVVVLVGASVFLVLSLVGEEAPREEGAAARGTSAAARPVHAARGLPPEERRPAEGPGAAVPPPPLLPGESRVPEPPVLPADTLKKRRRTRWLIKRLELAVELYRARTGHYPPSTLGEGNAVNEGVEALAAHLGAAGLLDWLDDPAYLGNTDGDAFPEGFSLLGKPLGGGERREILDAWGNPLVYFRSDRYASRQTCRISGEDQVAVPQVSRLAEEYRTRRVLEEKMPARRGPEYHGRDFVQIWSAGPDGRNENGGGDDVTSWNIRE